MRPLYDDRALGVHRLASRSDLHRYRQPGAASAGDGVIVGGMFVGQIMLLIATPALRLVFIGRRVTFPLRSSKASQDEGRASACSLVFGCVVLMQGVWFC